MTTHLVAVTNSSLTVTWTWFVIRAAGLTAMALLVSVVLMGIGMVTGLTYRFVEPLRAWAIHRAMSFALMAAVAVHVGFLLIDKFAPYTLANILVPFSVHYEHSSFFGLHAGSLYNAAGIVAMYLLLLVLISSLVIIESRKRTWRWLHFLSYVLMGLLFFHALFLGTDFRGGILRTVWIGVGALLVIGLGMRLRRSHLGARD